MMAFVVKGERRRPGLGWPTKGIYHQDEDVVHRGEPLKLGNYHTIYGPFSGSSSSKETGCLPLSPLWPREEEVG